MVYINKKMQSRIIILLNIYIVNIYLIHYTMILHLYGIKNVKCKLSIKNNNKITHQ